MCPSDVGLARVYAERIIKEIVSFSISHKSLGVLDNILFNFDIKIDQCIVQNQLRGIWVRLKMKRFRATCSPSASSFPCFAIISALWFNKLEPFNYELHVCICNICNAICKLYVKDVHSRSTLIGWQRVGGAIEYISFGRIVPVRSYANFSSIGRLIDRYHHAHKFAILWGGPCS